MKRLFPLIVIAGIIATALSSCKKEIDDPSSSAQTDEMERVMLGVSSENAKTAVDNLTVTWIENDGIDLFDDDNTKTSGTATESGTATVFDCEVVPGKDEWKAFYPAGVAGHDDLGYYMTIPAEQDGRFANSNFSAGVLHRSSSSSMYNQTGFIKLTVSGTNYSKITLSAVGGEKICGRLNVSFDDTGSVSTATDALEGSLITLKSSTGNLAAGTCYIAVAPGVTLSNGLLVQYYEGSSVTKSYYIEKNLTPAKNRFTSVGTLEARCGAFYVSVEGAGAKTGSNWANAMSKKEFKDLITLIENDSDKRSRSAARAAMLKDATFYLASGTYDLGECVQIGFNNDVTEYINFTFDGGYYNGLKDVQTHPTVFDGGNTHRLFELARYTDLAVMDCTFSHSSGSGGGEAAIRMASKYSKLNLSGCTLENNRNTATAGAINVDCGTASITNCTFSGNTATIGAAINVNNGGESDIDVTGQITVTGCTFNGNTTTSSSDGGAVKIQAGGPVSFNGCTFTGNTSKGYGAAVLVMNARETLTFTDCVFGTADSGNTATKSGGAFRFHEGACSAELNNCTIAYNASSSNGGAISLAGKYTGIVTINGGSISNCSATGNNYGGAIRQEGGTIIADGLHIDGCSAANGAAYSISGGSATFTECILGKDDRNSAGIQGGCIHMNNSAAPEFEDCYFSGYGANGGGVGTNGTSHPTFTNCQFVNCSSDEGGCVYTDEASYPTFSGCLFQECSVSVADKELGGAVRINSTECHPSFDNCKFENCEAFRGGAVYSECAYTSGSINFNKCEFTGCYAFDEGGCVNMRSSAPVTYNFTDCSFHDNNSPWGALYCNNGNSSYRTTVNVTGGDFTRNIGQRLNDTSYNNGAALYPSTRATFNVSGVRLEGNVADKGPAVFLAAETAICNCEDCEFIKNEAKTNGGVIFANTNTTQFYCNSSVFDNNIADAGAVYGNIKNNFKAYFNACSFKNNNWNKTYSGLTYFGEDNDKPTGNVMGINNCSGCGNYNNGTSRTAQQCTWINLKTDRGLKFIFANNSFIGNLEDANGICSNVSGAPGIIRLDNKSNATSVNLYLANNILMNLSDDKDHDNFHCGIAFSGSTDYPTQYCNFNKGQAKRVQKTEDSGYFGYDSNGTGRHKNNFTNLTWKDDSNLWKWNGSGSGSNYLGETATINKAISDADSDFYAWLISVGAIGSDGKTAKDARGETRGTNSWPGSYDDGGNK